jgi:hypothetical protein
MRNALIGIGALVAAFMTSTVPSHAVGPWCLQGGLLARGNFDDCSFHTLEQCKWAGGNGAAPCIPNKNWLWREREYGRRLPPAKTPIRKPRY